MVYLCGMVGFVFGFLAGLCIINLFLKNYPKRDLLHDKSLRWTYGLAVWILGGLGAWGAVTLYHHSIL